MRDFTKVRDTAVADARESEIIRANENAGMNIDTTYIINPEKFRAAQSLAASDFENMDELMSRISDSSVSDAEKRAGIITAAHQELDKPADLQKKLGSLPDGCNIRINTYPPESPFFDLGNADVPFDPVLEQQLSSVCSKAGGGKLNIAVAPYTKDAGAHLPSGHDEQDAYIKICEKVINGVGKDAYQRKSLTLELGNEMNLSQETMDSELFPRRPIDPKDYAKWYYDTASRLKENNPDLKCAIAGTAFCDKQWLKTVVSEIKKYDPDCYTVDTISFHPYRETADSATADVNHGHFCDRYKWSNIFRRLVGEEQKTVTYEDQLEDMRQISELADCGFVVGEVNYNQPGEWGKSVDLDELGKEVGTNIETYIWPSSAITIESRMQEMISKQLDRVQQAESILSEPDAKTEREFSFV